MVKLDERKQKILGAIIEDYLRTAEPVSSKFIREKHGLELSSATIRNEMAALEEAGYIRQPHTSAGRIPSDKGYRYYVNELMKQKPLSHKEKQFIEDEFKRIGEDFEDIIMRTLKVLSFLSHYATAIVAPKSKKERVYSSGITNILKLPEFKDISHARPVLEIFEQEEVLAETLKEHAAPNAVSITIGKENKVKHLKETSVVITSYNFSESIRGAIGIIGPTRMFYGHTQAIVSQVANNLSSLLSEEE